MNQLHEHAHGANETLNEVLRVQSRYEKKSGEHTRNRAETFNSQNYLIPFKFYLL